MTVQKQDALKFNNDFNRIKYRSNQWSKRAPSGLKMRINICDNPGRVKEFLDAGCGVQVMSSEAVNGNTSKIFDALEGLGSPVAHISVKGEQTVPIMAATRTNSLYAQKDRCPC